MINQKDIGKVNLANQEVNDLKGHLDIEDRGSVLVVRVDGGPHSLFGLDIANQLDKLVDRADNDPTVHAVVFTGAHPDRFVSHGTSGGCKKGVLRSHRLADVERQQ